MNRQGLAVGIVAAVLLVAGAAYWALRTSDGPPEAVAPPVTGADRAEAARSLILELEQSREAAPEQVTEPPAEQAPVIEPTIEPPDLQAAAPAAVEPRPQAEVTPAPAAPQTGTDSAASDLDTAFARAQAFQSGGQLADAQVLYFYGARSGHAPSAFELGAMNDPLHHSPSTSLLAEPDPFQAYRWYSAARDQGMEAAAERLAALHEWAIDAAEAGDIDAEQLLLQWE